MEMTNEELIITFKKNGSEIEVSVQFPVDQNAEDVISVLENTANVLRQKLKGFAKKERHKKVIKDFIY
jgi:predicted metal-dependent hydrolase